MVIPTGFEPVASRLGILRSILLSYRTSHQKRLDLMARATFVRPKGRSAL